MTKIQFKKAPHAIHYGCISTGHSSKALADQRGHLLSYYQCPFFVLAQETTDVFTAHLLWWQRRDCEVIDALYVFLQYLLEVQEIPVS